LPMIASQVRPPAGGEGPQRPRLAPVPRRNGTVMARTAAPATM
jgi:hypothetical protein